MVFRSKVLDLSEIFSLSFYSILNYLVWDTPIEEWAREPVTYIPNESSLGNLITNVSYFAEVERNQVLLLQELFELLVVFDNKVAPSF